ncbi:uncharacterized protein LOC131680598 [Topomyia yanbarensis]|uniref:uncharacterized protein LOC131680598 n=1 Tax=Topomyia yanbarensis TaxID=2498891 RepID=UPI00273CC810|nr:uncharacterized protein LOC131680598 [Topomyia yanbarensis]
MASGSDWINGELLQQLLKAEHASSENQSLEILKYSVCAATKKGDNYASEMFRATIEYVMDNEQRKCTRILKVIPSGDIQRIVMEKNNIFPREIAVYKDILPRIHRLLKSIGDLTVISPKCTLTTDHPKVMLVFEDLKENAYQMVDRKRGLDKDQTILVLRKLAKLHACSAVVHKEYPEIMEPVLEGAISTNPNRQDFLVFYKMCARQVVKLVDGWKETKFEPILEKLRNLPETTIAKGCQVYTRDDSVFNVLNHDDVWTSNMMFKYTDGIADDVLLLDYQLAYFGSPGVDLNYFLYGSVEPELRKRCWLEFIREYYDILKDTLQKLRFEGPIPSLQEIHVEIMRTGYHSTNAVFCLLPLAMMENTENAEMDVFLQDSDAGEAFRQQIFSNPRYEPILKEALIEFDLLGYLDGLTYQSHCTPQCVSAGLQPLQPRFAMTEHCEIERTSNVWRNAAFYVDVVGVDLNLPVDACRILDVQIANATSKTAGYMSLMHRVTVRVEFRGDGQQRDLTYIVKEKSDQVFGREMVDGMFAFPKEIEVYSTFLPAFERLWKTDAVKLGPRMFKAVTSSDTVLILEDLKPLGFCMKDCSKGLNLMDCERVLEKLAKFHAASVVYYEKNGSYSEQFNDGIFSDRLVPQFEEYYTPLFNSYSQSLEDLGYPAYILDALRPWKGKAYSTLSRLYQTDYTKFNVLNHGDVWINNLQFSENELLLVDFQVAFYGSPSFDLIYFIITSAELDVRTDKFDHLIDHYYQHLVKDLQQLNAVTTVPTLQQLHQDITDHGFLACILSMESLAMMLALPELELDMELLEAVAPDGVEYRRKLYSGHSFVLMMEKLVPFMWDRGLFKIPELWNLLSSQQRLSYQSHCTPECVRAGLQPLQPRFAMTEHCEIERTAKAWRDAAFYMDVVGADLNLPVDAFRILDVRIANATSKTAGFMSLMHRVTVRVEFRGDGQQQDLSYIVKEKSDQVIGHEMVDGMFVFPKEIEVYNTFLPAFERLWKTDAVKLGPRMFKTVTSSDAVLILEDLKPLGFCMKDCSKGLNLMDCERVLEKLAKFHAASVVYYEQNGSYSDQFNDGIFSDRLVSKFEEYYAPLFNSFLQSLEDLGYPAYILDALRPWKGKAYLTLSRLYRTDHTKFNVLNHGDVWINNLQFSENELLLVDFQVAFYGSPSFDLIYFIINSAELDVRTDKFDHLIDHYYQHLVNDLQQLNAVVTVPTLQELHRDITDHGFLACILAMESLPMMFTRMELDMELFDSETPDGVEYRRKLYSGHSFVLMMEKLVPFMWDRGFFRIPE